MDPDHQLRNVSGSCSLAATLGSFVNGVGMTVSLSLLQLRDFLLVYNRMTEICFQRCTSNFNYRNLTMDEVRGPRTIQSPAVFMSGQLVEVYALRHVWILFPSDFMAHRPFKLSLESI